MSTTPTLLTVEEVAAQLRVPAATVRYWRHQGVGPKSFKVGRRVLFDAADVRDWLLAQKEEA